jgi:hypothetical protein
VTTWAPVLAGQAPAPDQWALRIPLTLAVLGTAALLCWLMWRSYSRRMTRQETRIGAALPAVPADLGDPVLAPADVYYVGSTAAGAWLERVAALGLTERSEARVELFDAGLLVTRTSVDRGADQLFVPGAALRGARSDRALAGKVVAEGGMLVVTWVLGATELDTGLVVHDRTAQAAYVRALNDAVGAVAARRTPETPASPSTPREEPA